MSAAIEREAHQIRALSDASHVAARTVGFLTAMLDCEQIDPLHHAAARDLIRSARDVMETPMFPQSPKGTERAQQAAPSLSA